MSIVHGSHFKEAFYNLFVCLVIGVDLFKGKVTLISWWLMLIWREKSIAGLWLTNQVNNMALAPSILEEDK